ncbi:hypothetical protein ScPMuIL_003195 [Solemya velum]
MTSVDSASHQDDRVPSCSSSGAVSPLGSKQLALQEKSGSPILSYSSISSSQEITSSVGNTKFKQEDDSESVPCVSTAIVNSGDISVVSTSVQSNLQHDAIENVFHVAKGGEMLSKSVPQVPISSQEILVTSSHSPVSKRDHMLKASLETISSHDYHLKTTPVSAHSHEYTISTSTDNFIVNTSPQPVTHNFTVSASSDVDTSRDYITTSTDSTSANEISVIQFENYGEQPDSRVSVTMSMSDVSQSETVTTTPKSEYNLADDEVEHGIADTQTDQDPNATMACLVCGDKGSGYHYSVFSCEGCKGFFKRSVQKSLSYNCRDQGNCVINKFTRNSCQHCRFMRCMQMGMRRDAVREDRSPGGKHRHKRQRTDEFCVAVSTDDNYRIIQSEGVEASDEIRDSLIESLIAADPDAIPTADGHQIQHVQDLGVNEVMQYGYAELKYIIDWAKKVPGFHELCMEDQMALLKSSFMELSVLRLSYRSTSLNNSINFAEGLTIPVDIAQNMGWGKELITATIDFSKRLKDIDLDHTEFCILNGIILTYPDASGLAEKLQVIKLQTRILDALRRYVTQQYADQPDRLGRLLLRIPSLRVISAKAAERFLSLTLDGSVQLNDLVLEMIN